MYLQKEIFFIGILKATTKKEKDPDPPGSQWYGFADPDPSRIHNTVSYLLQLCAHAHCAGYQAAGSAAGEDNVEPGGPDRDNGHQEPGLGRDPSDQGATRSLHRHGQVGAHQGVKQRCRLSWLTNSALVYEPKWGGGG